MATKLSFPFSCLVFLVFLVLPVFSHFQYPHNLKGNELLDNKAVDTSPFGFLKKLEGCCKGQKVKGIHNLKDYLSRLGYLNYAQNDPNKGQDYFDDELEVAVKSFQVFYHLNATGSLDGPTVSKMMMPRCGFPDKETHQHSNGSIHTVSHYQFFPGQPRWPVGKKHLTYGFGPLFPAKFRPSIARAFNKWATASQYFTFSRVDTFQGADIKIDFARRGHGDRTPFDGPGGILAHAFNPPDGRLHFDQDEHWVDGAAPNTFDMETIALHEIGHLLGLAHSQFQNAIMWSSFSPGVIKRLSSDDIQGIKSLYRS